ncbi:MAG: extracellular solute-binding protein [Desulfobacteraceae bacterium]
MAIVTQEKLDRAYELYQEGRLSRRHFLKYLGLAGASLGLVGAPFGGAIRSAWAAKSIRFDGWGGSVSEAFRKHAFQPFTKATGIKVIDGEFGDMNSYLTRVKASYNTKHISKAKAEKLGASLLWDKSLKGKLGSWEGDFRTNMWYAALHCGQSPNNITDLKAIWAALREQRGLMKKYWSSGAELMSLLANEEIYATVAWSGRVAALQQEGHPIGYLSPKETYSWMEYLFVLKGTDLEVAQKLLNFMLEPAAAIAVAEGQNYPPSLDPSKVALTEKIKKMPAFDPTGKLEGYLFANPSYWNAHQVEWTEKWDRIKAGS